MRYIDASERKNRSVRLAGPGGVDNEENNEAITQRKPHSLNNRSSHRIHRRQV